MTQVITEEVRKSPIATFGALLAKKSLGRVRERMDDSHYGGAVLLGLSGLLVVAHGHSNPTAIRHAIRVAKQAIERDVIEKIRVRIEEATTDVAEIVAPEDEISPEPSSTEHE